jgi:hypothetical protein
MMWDWIPGVKEAKSYARNVGFLKATATAGCDVSELMSV